MELELRLEADVSALPDGVKSCIADMATAIFILIFFVEVPPVLKLDPRYLKDSSFRPFILMLMAVFWLALLTRILPFSGLTSIP